ncbi:hypothetical protein H7F21_06525 [Winogradskyella flava]|uniref:Uncharacterized protein n=2 Tax=Winogradskyella flava TaxID=1884876 RepID=A0A842ISJ4_9FLAO|nr:hypothetical protein [Winogradskyella flava]MBC2844743.1 hypothetical protein [Winogradskyella flava]
MKNLFKISLLIFLFASILACSDDDGPNLNAEVTIGNVIFDNGDDFNGDVDGDFTGDGGSVTRTFNWQNSFSRADYNADITATADGIFNMVVEDADGTIVLDRSLNGAEELDSFSGETISGTPGIWSVIITLTDFNGDGSFSLSEED